VIEKLDENISRKNKRKEDEIVLYVLRRI
jgi:hypothetical protein